MSNRKEWSVLPLASEKHPHEFKWTRTLAQIEAYMNISQRALYCLLSKIQADPHTSAMQ